MLLWVPHDVNRETTHGISSHGKVWKQRALTY